MSDLPAFRGPHDLPAPEIDEPASTRSVGAIVLLLASLASNLVVAVGGLLVLLTFAGTCFADDDCDSWKRIVVPWIVLALGVASVVLMIVGLVALASTWSRRVQLTVAAAALSSSLVAMLLEVGFFTR